MALLEWEGALNGGPFTETQVIDLSNEVSRGGVLAVDFGFRTVVHGALISLSLSWSWTDPAGDVQTFNAGDLSLLVKGSIVSGFRMLKASRDAIPDAVFTMTMSKSGIGPTSWNGWLRIP